MNATAFVAIVIVLTFAIGFFVASIIWVISWAMMPKKESTTIKGFMKSFNSHYKPRLTEPAIPVLDINGQNLPVTEETKNKELYKFYHGKN